MNNTQGGKPDNIIFTTNIDENINIISAYFNENETLIKRYIVNSNSSDLRFCILYTDGMVDNEIINNGIIRPLLIHKFSKHTSNIIDIIAKQVIFSNEVSKTTDIEDILQAIVYGDCVLFAEDCSEALVLNTKGWKSRGIEEPEGERVLKGPREGFNESLIINLSMLRRRLRTPDLKMKFMVFGTKTKTKACICYLDSIVNKDILAELLKRLNKISIDGVLDTNYIVELIKDSPYSPIKTVGNTERPDVTAAKLLEGRVALFLDGTPVVITVPHLFIENFQSDEDYYVSFIFASFGRFLRLLSFFISTTISSIYLSLITFHHEMLPTPLLESISASRQSVPFPSVVELVIMLIIFDILREAGARMPGMTGQALSIVGALVIGQAAVEAKIVSAPIIIIVALSGITSLMIPRVTAFTIILRFSLILCSSILGIYGFLFGFICALIHLFSLTSFGIPIMTEAFSTDFQDKKDIFIRAPWHFMKSRPKLLSSNRIRQSNNGNEK